MSLKLKALRSIRPAVAGLSASKTVAKSLVFVLAVASLFSALGIDRAAADDSQVPVSAANQSTVWVTHGSPHSFDNPNRLPDSNTNVWVGMGFKGGASATSFSSQILGRADTNVLCDPQFSCLDRTKFSNFSAQGEFPVCDASHPAPCAEGLQYELGDSGFKDAQLQFVVDPTPNNTQISNWEKQVGHKANYEQNFMGWSSSDNPGLPAAAKGPTVYRFPGVINSAGTDTYLLSANYFFEGNIGADKKISGKMTDFQTAVTPVFVDTTKSGAVVNAEYTEPNSGQLTVGSSYITDTPYDTTDVAFLSNKAVGFGAQFPAGITLRLKVKLPKALGGWFQGRATAPVLTVTDAGDNSNEVVMEAQPVSVPIAQADFDPFDDSNSALVQLFNMKASGMYDSLLKDRDAGRFGLRTGFAWTPSLGIKPFQLLSASMGNKAQGYISQWRFNKFGGSVGDAGCFSDNSSLQGLLTTNSMTYQAELPTYQAGSLNYSVAGLHYDANGDVFRGTYSFIMRDSVAKCLYGFKGTAPMQGTVSVTSSDGQENVAFTNVTDREGWLSLTAQGFTFSNPVISARLTQAPDPTPSVAAQGSSGGKATKNVTITCVKGKITKKVVGVSPKCPSGYKKKA